MNDPKYAEPEELKDFIGKTSNTDDTKLNILILAAEDLIDSYCNRPDGFLAISTGTARVYAGSGKAYQRIDECISISAVAVKTSPSASSYTAWATTDYIKFSGDPEYPDFNRLPYTGIMIDPNGDYSSFTASRYSHRAGFRPVTGTHRGVPTVQVTAKWGYSATVPNNVKTAVIAQASRWHKRFEGGWSDALASADMGQMLYRQGLDSKIKLMLDEARLVVPVI